MEFDSYQKESKETAQYQAGIPPLAYVALGLAGETGEVVEKIKKVLRNDGGTISFEKRTDLSNELGDVLWYLAQIATEIDVSLEDIAQQNLDKLLSRLDRGVIRSEGDTR